MLRSLVKPLGRGLLTVGLSLVLAVLMFHFVFQPFQVAGLSMAPALEDRDYLLVDRLFFRQEGLGRGDMVVFRTEGDRRFLVKRIAGLPGETVAIHDGHLTVGGRSVDHQSFPTRPGEEFGPISLGPEEYFCLGDNAAKSLDSRIFGPVRRSQIYGRVLLRYLPLERSGLLTEQVHAR